MLRSRGLRALVGRLRYSLLHQFLLIVSLLAVLMLYRSAVGGGSSEKILAVTTAKAVPVTVADESVSEAVTKEEKREQAATTSVVSPTARKQLCGHRPAVNQSNSVGKGQTALITGVAGFVGSHVARYCLHELGLTVIGLDDLSSGKASNVPAGVEFHQGNFGDSKLLHRLFASYRFDYVYHLAGHAGETISHHVRSFTYDNELVSSSKLLNAVLRAGGTRSFVFLSSTSVYADSGQGAMATIHSEISNFEPMSPMAIAKLAFEHDLQLASKSFGLSYTILRAHNLYGPHQNLQDPYHSVVSSFIRQHLNQRRTESVTIYGDGTQQRAFTYISDVAPLIGMSPFVPAAEKQIINVGSDELTSINDLKKMVGDVLGRPRSATFVKSHTEHASIQVDHSKMRCIFGYRDETSLEEGLSRLVPHILAIFSGKADIQSMLDVNHAMHVEIADGLPFQSWEGHEVDVVKSMGLSEQRDMAVEDTEGA